jgi:hypothetical protein
VAGQGVPLIPDRKARNWRRGVLAWFLLTTMIAGWLLGATPSRGGLGSPGSLAVARADVPARAPGRRALGPDQADVTIPGPGGMKAIPDAFLGLSTEYSTLPLVEKHIALYERVIDNLFVRVEHRQPLVLRIGGDSAEHVRYDKKEIHFPPWAFTFDRKVASKTTGVMNDLRLRVIIDINTISSNPKEVGAWMKDFTTSERLQTGTVVAFELGNEPDIYDRKAWRGGKLKATDHSTLQKGGRLPPNLPKRITATSFARKYLAYARALHKAAPNVPLVAPALAKATDHLGWIRTLLRHRTKMLRVISAHVYPYSACAKPGQAKYPTIQKVLSENATFGMVRTIRPTLAFAHKAGLSFRLTEINSVTCGGVQGVSNTFATALWAPDALFELMRAGVEGVHLHARVESINRPFSFDSHGLQTRPVLYGLMLFTRMLKGGVHARLVPVTLRSGRSVHLKVWAVRQTQADSVAWIPFIPNPLNVLVLNKGRRSALITLHLPTSSPAFLERLLAPSASSTSGVTLEGQQLNHQAEWQGKQKLRTLRPTRNGSYVLRVRGASAAMLTVPVAASTLTATPQNAAGAAPLLGYQ